MTALKISAANEINRAQTGGNSPASIDAYKIGFGNLARVTLREIKAS
jgi:hypothetical protein